MAQWRFKGRKGDRYVKITSSTTETQIIMPYTDENNNPVRVGIYGLIIANTSSSACKVTIKDALGGGDKMVIEVPALDTRGFMGEPEEPVLEQDAGNNAWTATCGTSVDSIEITAFFSKD